MEARENVTADPSLRDSALLESYFACNTAEKRRPSLPITRSSWQINLRAAVHTGDLKNPFALLEGSNIHVVHFCTMCRDKKCGWHVIANPRKYSKGQSSRALQAWAVRVS